MLPEISARRSLLEPSFRYLSPGREGEKCRPLDHMGQIPFIHSDRFLTCSNFYIYTIVYQLFLPCGTYKCVYMTIAHAPLQKTQIMFPSHFLSPFFPKVHAGVHWNSLLAKSLFVLQPCSEDKTINCIGLKSTISSLPRKQMIPNTLFFLLRSLLIAEKNSPNPR